MNLYYMTCDKGENRLYSPVLDGLAFTPSDWENEVNSKFISEVVANKKEKYNREEWRKLTKAQFKYRVLYFHVDLVNSCKPLYVCVSDYFADGSITKYDPIWYKDNSLGKFLTDKYFYTKFQPITIDKFIPNSTCQIPTTVVQDILDRWKQENKEPMDNWEYKVGTGIPTKDAKLYTTSSIANNFSSIDESAITGGPVKSNSFKDCEDTIKHWTEYFSINTTGDPTTGDPTKFATNTVDWKYDTIATTGTPITVNGYDSNKGYVGISLDDTIKDNLKEISDRLDKLENKKEDKKMKMFNFDFGPIKDNDAIRMSPYGIAVKNVNGTYQAYDKVNGEMMDVDVFNFKADNMFFKMPVAVDAVGVGDVIIFNRKPCFVFGFSEQGDVIVIDIALGEKKTILPNKSPFGFNYITKVVSLMDNMFGGSTPSAENPFGNILPFMMMSEDSSMKDMLPMMMFMNGGGAGSANPNLMLYLMMQDGNKDMDKWMPLLFMNMAK